MMQFVIRSYRHIVIGGREKCNEQEELDFFMGLRYILKDHVYIFYSVLCKNEIEKYMRNIYVLWKESGNPMHQV